LLLSNYQLMAVVAEVALLPANSASLYVEGVSFMLNYKGWRQFVTCATLRNSAGNYVVIRGETPAGFALSTITNQGLRIATLTGK